MWAGATGTLRAGMLPAKRVIVPRSPDTRPPRSLQAPLPAGSLLSAPPSHTLRAEQGDVREHQDEREGKCRDKARDCQGKEATFFSNYSKYKSSSSHISWEG